MKNSSAQKRIAAFKSYLRAILASAITMGVALLTNMKPEYAVLIGALAGPLAKWADKNEGSFGVGSEE
jgi:hypothetical protein